MDVWDVGKQFGGYGILAAGVYYGIRAVIPVIVHAVTRNTEMFKQITDDANKRLDRVTGEFLAELKEQRESRSREMEAMNKLLARRRP